MKRQHVFRWLLTTIEITVGFSLIVSAAYQSFAIQLFAVNLTVYRSLRDPMFIQILSIIAINVEIILGLFLLVGSRMGSWAYSLPFLCVASLNVFILYSRFFDGTRQCICFGTQITSARFCFILTAIVAFSLAIALILSWQERRFVESERLRRFFLGRNVLTAVPLAVIFNVGLYVNAIDTEDRNYSPTKDCKGKPFCSLFFQWKDKKLDLTQGTYLVVMLNTTCNQCRESIEDINRIHAALPEAIPLVGVCLGTQDLLEDFMLETQPDFPMFIIGPLRFHTLIEDKTPRLLVVHDGEIRHSWEIHIPPPEEVLESLDDVDARNHT